MRAALIDLASSGWIGSQQPSARAPATCSRATPLHSKRGAPPGHPAEAGHPDGPADKPGRRSRPGLPAGSLTLDQPKLAECQAPVRTGALLLTDSAATVSRRAAQLYRSQREDSNLALLVSFLMSASPSGEARPLTGTQESVLFRTGLGGLRPPRMGGQLCERPTAKQIRNLSPPKRRKRISRLTVTPSAVVCWPTPSGAPPSRRRPNQTNVEFTMTLCTEGTPSGMRRAARGRTTGSSCARRAERRRSRRRARGEAVRTAACCQGQHARRARRAPPQRRQARSEPCASRRAARRQRAREARRAPPERAPGTE